MSHSYIASRYGVQTSGLCLGINTTNVVNTMIPIFAMAQLFDMLVSVLTCLFQFCSCEDHYMSIDSLCVSFLHCVEM